MVPITFSVLGVAACAFLTYVFVQFRRELLNGRRNPAGQAKLTGADIYRIEAALMLARPSSNAHGRPKANVQAAMRKQLVTSAIFGVVGLLAPFIFLVLLNSDAWSR